MQRRTWCVALLIAGMAIGMGTSGTLTAAEPEFRRGDVNNSGDVNLSDPIALLTYLFSGGSIPCRDAADFNDSGDLNIADAIGILSYLFSGGAPPADPGPMTCGPDPTLDTLECLEPPCGGPDPARLDAGHLLARATFGARPGQVDDVIAVGAQAWLDAQIIGVDDALNAEYTSRVAQLTDSFPRTIDTEHFVEGAIVRYWKGTAALPANWMTTAFDDSAWEVGPTPLRFGFGRDGTQVLDMQGGYTSLAIRGTFQLDDPTTLPPAALRMDFDDGFVAWINGVEVARQNVTGAVPGVNQTATANHQAGLGEYWDIPAGVLVAGENLIAVHGFNRNLNNGDFYLEARVVTQEPIVGAPDRVVFTSKGALQQWPFFRARYSENELRTVLAMFWDNHFTTDYDKTRDYIITQRDRFNRRTIEGRQANLEAATVEAEEHQFFFDNAFGNFGDLLLYSASEPSMLIYLDSVLNDAAEPNENYAREILELFGLGVDNGYTQADVEEVARCFTGWNVEKVPYASVLPFPDRAVTPNTDPADTIIPTSWIAVGDTWNYFKGTTEPSPGAGGVPTTAWTEIGFDDSTWFAGPTGIGIGDGDDATVLTDMQGNYTSVYLRKTFNVTDPYDGGRFELDVRYDDGCVVYLNGVEVGRAPQMAASGSPPPFNAPTNGHEVTAVPLLIDLEPYRELLVVGDNVLAIQVHNTSLNNNDLSIIPHLYTWEPGPGFIELEDRQGHWQFRFDPALHDTGAKTVFAGTPYELQIPAGRLGSTGVQDGIDVVDAIVDHPATAEFICVKLIGLLVSDEIDLPSAHDLSAPIELRALLAEAIAAWNSTTPKGNIETVVRTILSADDPAGTFWGDLARGAKVKTPFEHIASTVRALEADITGRSLTDRIAGMGQTIFDRDDPDGWPERGDRWIGTTSLLKRINFVREVAEVTNVNSFSWDAVAFVQANGASSAAEIIDLFDDVLYQGTLNGAERLLLLRFAEIDPNSGAIVPFDPLAGDYEARVEKLVGMMLSMPRWCFQ